MSIGKICTRNVATISRQGSIAEAAQSMRRKHVGALIVVDEERGSHVPVGIVTDRDIVIEVLAAEVPPSSVTVGDVMSRDLVMVKEDLGILETIEVMRDKGVRRMPIIDDSGELAGIVSADDLLELLSTEIAALGSMVWKELRREKEVRN